MGGKSGDMASITGIPVGTQSLIVCTIQPKRMPLNAKNIIPMLNIPLDVYLHVCLSLLVYA